MSAADLLTNLQYYELKLAPQLKALRKPMTCKPVLAKIQTAQGVLGCEEWMLKGPKLKTTGLDPTTLRQSCADQPKQMAEFLWACASGKLHVSCWQYLLGPVTQLELRAGQRASFGTLPGLGNRPKDAPAMTGGDKFSAEVDKNISIDDDYKRVARKRSFDADFERKILGERPHLLEGK